MSMEVKLLYAAMQLPQSNLDFQSIERKLCEAQKPIRNPQIFRRVVFAAVLVLCLCTTVFAYGRIHYGLWSAYRSSSFADVELLSRRYDYVFPEEINGSPFFTMSTSVAAPHGSSHLEALLSPTYKLHSIDYGMRLQEQWEDGLYEWTTDWICVSFGTTEADAWKYHFSVAEDGTCNDEKVAPESQRTVEYAEMVLHLYTIDDRCSVRWEDEQRELVIDVTCWEVSGMDTVLKAAKALIDLNR